MISAFVLDNSVAMRWLFGDGAALDQSYAAAVLDSMGVVYVPGIWALEVANVIARAEAKGLIAEAQSENYLRLLGQLDIRISEISLPQAVGAILQLARRYRLSSYDASYLELALRLGLPLATVDSDLRRAAQQAGVPIHAA